MELTPREKDKLLIFTAALLAAGCDQRRAIEIFNTEFSAAIDLRIDARRLAWPSVPADCWEPSIRLRDGLARTIDWFRSIDITAFRAPTPNY